MEILYQDYTTFSIFGNYINLISNETDYGISTVAEFDNQFYYLGNEPPTLESAIFVYQDIKKVLLTTEEFIQITIENSDLKSENGEKYHGNIKEDR